MASLIDVFGRLLLEDDGRKFIASSVKAGEKAGDQTGKTMGQRISAGLKANVGTGARIAAGAAAGAFAIASKGALEMEESMARYRAETGATAEEAKRAIGAVNQIAGRQRQSLEAVTDVAILVKKDLGAVGVEADKLTEDFVRFGRVTRQDAAGAVSAFDDILDSWGLTTADAAGLMDRLLVSNQKFGGSIEANQSTLAALAPAMRAANLEIGDGIELLNLFGAKGLDANTASAAFAKALTKVKSPQELQDLIADISATEDPFLRAEKAANLFGARAGAKLANALAGANLDDYAVSLEEAAGATVEAGDALDSTFGARLQRLMSEAGAAVRGFGADLGPAVTGLASLASLGGAVGLDKVLAKGFGKLAASGLVKGAAGKAGAAIGLVFSTAMFASDKIGSVLATALNALPGSGAVKGATSSVGKLLGTTLGKFAAVGLAGVLLVEVVNTYNQVKAQIEQQNAQISGNVAKQVATGTTASLEQSKAALEQGLKDINGVWDAGLFTTDSRKRLEADLAAVDAELARRASAMPGHVGEALADGAPAVQAGAEEMVDPITGEVEDALGPEAQQAAHDAAYGIGAAIPPAIGEGVLAMQGSVDTAMATLKNLIENERTPAQQAAHVIGTLISKEVANGVESGRPGVKAAATSLREGGEAELREFIAGGGKIGKDSMEALRKGMKSKDPEVRAQSKRTIAIVKEETDKLKGIGKKGGQGLGDGTKSGIDSKRGAVKGAAGAYKTTIRAQLPSSSEAKRWGSGLGANYAAGIRSSKKWIEQAARNAAAAAAAIFATHSPPGPQSPLHLIDVWGARTIQEFAGGMSSAIPAVKRAAQAAAAGAALLARGVDVPVNAFGQAMAARLPEYVPPVPGTIAPRMPWSTGALPPAAAVGGTTFNLSTYGMPMRAETPTQVARKLRRAHRLGLAVPPTRVPRWDGGPA